MRKIILVSLGISVFVIGLVLGNTKTSNNVFAQSQASDVALVMCAADPVNVSASATRSILVTASSGSSNIHPVRGADCAQALSDLLRGGFKIFNVTPRFNTDGSLYTLTK